MIDSETRQRYDYKNIERLYTEYVAEKVDDHSAIEILKDVIKEKEVLILVPGNTLNTHRTIIDEYICQKNPVVISVNFVAEDVKSYVFFGNQKRYTKLKEKRCNRKIIISSNIKSDSAQDIIVNYHSIINRGYKYFENSTIMLLNILKRVNPKRVIIAGFDGFDENTEKNYIDRSYQNGRHVKEFKTLNQELSEMFGDIVKTMYPVCKFDIITPSLYNKVLSDIYGLLE